ncbi:site-2 protease family protein [Patescibacteria group bacterium]|nr:site-2 protease family protein [Patescibacteria group bacterium]MBU1728111.1 site-2 protease family protein [Patescibacteria group bacterium]
MQATDAIFFIIILIMSVVIHEVSHGFMAEYCGDKTARHAGRLTLNPLKHLDMFGSIILPALLYFSSGFVFGWAKPVPYNPDNLRNRRWGTIAVASAGVLANFFIAILFGMILRFSSSLSVPTGFHFIISSIVVINLALAIFNLVPIPPLDGSKILFNILPESFYPFFRFVERYSLILLIIFIFLFVDHLFPILAYLYHLITNLSLI